MKKVCTALLLLGTLTACSQEESNSVPTETADDSTGLIGGYREIEIKEFPSLDGIPVDLDFSELSATLRFSLANLMMVQPQDYWGKTIRIDGQYMFLDTPEFGDVHLVLIMDETNCCQGYMEFELPSGAPYPQDGDYIGLVGEFTQLVTPELTYTALVVDKFAY